MSLPLDNWFTGPRIEKLAVALQAVSTDRLGMPKEDTVRAIWRECGGNHEEARRVLQVLASLDLVTISEDSVRRADSGSRVVRRLRTGDYRLLGLTIIQAGFFSEQSRSLLESGEVDGDGNLVCYPRIATLVAPQLIGLLSRWPDFQSLPRVLIPSGVVNEISAVWALQAPESDEPTWVQQRRRVGDRAELYSFQLERSEAKDASAIAWVAKDSDSFGWDIEDRTVTPYRVIEVKGSRGPAPVFYLSENEWNQAAKHGSTYEVQFWGDIDLQRKEASEYAALRNVGYPIVISNIREKIDSGAWIATPTKWRISEGEASY